MKSTLGKVMGVLTSGSYLAAVIASAKDANMLHALDARTGKPAVCCRSIGRGEERLADAP